MVYYIPAVVKMAGFLRKKENIELTAFFVFGVDKSLRAEVLYFFYGKKHFACGVAAPEIYLRHLSQRDPISLDDIYAFVLERYMDYYLFQMSNHGEFYYDDYSDLLNIRQFRHSTLLEIV